MKLRISKLFDSEAIIKIFREGKIQGIDDFVNAVSQLFDNILEILRNNVSLDDNIACRTKELSLFHNETLTIDSPERLRPVRHIIATRALPFANPVSSLAWQFDSDGRIQIRPQFIGAPTSQVVVTLVMFF